MQVVVTILVDVEELIFIFIILPTCFPNTMQRLADPSINNFMFIVMAVEMNRPQQLQLRCPDTTYRFEKYSWFVVLISWQTLERAAPLQTNERFGQQVVTSFTKPNL